MPAITLEQAKAAKRDILQEYGHLGEVIGVGITRRGDDYVVKVNLSEAPHADSTLPQVHDGVPIVVEVVGQIKAR